MLQSICPNNNLYRFCQVIDFPVYLGPLLTPFLFFCRYFESQSHGWGFLLNGGSGQFFFSMQNWGADIRTRYVPGTCQSFMLTYHARTTCRPIYMCQVCLMLWSRDMPSLSHVISCHLIRLLIAELISTGPTVI